MVPSVPNSGLDPSAQKSLWCVIEGALSSRPGIQVVRTVEESSSRLRQRSCSRGLTRRSYTRPLHSRMGRGFPRRRRRPKPS